MIKLRKQETRNLCFRLPDIKIDWETYTCDLAVAQLGIGLFLPVGVLHDRLLAWCRCRWLFLALLFGHRFVLICSSCRTSIVLLLLLLSSRASCSVPDEFRVLSQRCKKVWKLVDLLVHALELVAVDWVCWLAHDALLKLLLQSCALWLQGCQCCGSLLTHVLFDSTLWCFFYVISFFIVLRLLSTALNLNYTGFFPLRNNWR